MVYGGVEPDAEHYTCGACGAPRVVGFEEAMVRGRILIIFEGE
jgi:hypothetical protein